MNKHILRKHFTLILMLSGACFTTTACNGKETPAQQTQQTASIDDAQGNKDKLTKAYLKQRVEAIYTDVCETYAEATRKGGVPSNDNLDGKYCSKHWNGMLKRIVEIDKRSEDGMGFFDADYWILGQDFQYPSFKNVNVVDINGKKATVTLIVHNFDDIPVTLEMVFERNDWYIDNIIDNKVDLNWGANMQEYIDENP